MDREWDVYKVTPERGCKAPSRLPYRARSQICHYLGCVTPSPRGLRFQSGARFYRAFVTSPLRAGQRSHLELHGIILFRRVYAHSSAGSPLFHSTVYSSRAASPPRLQSASSHPVNALYQRRGDGAVSRNLI